VATQATTLASRTAELDAQEKALAAGGTELAHARKEAAETAARLASLEAQLAARETELATRGAEIETLRESVFADATKLQQDVAQEVEAMTEGQIRMGPGTLYGSIQRMLNSGLIEEVARTTGRVRGLGQSGAEEERRRYYRLSAFGRRVLELELARLARVVVLARAKHLLPDPV